MMQWKQQKNLSATGHLKSLLQTAKPVCGNQGSGNHWGSNKDIPYEVRVKYPFVPWKDLAGIRDKLIHAYFGVNLKVVWLSVKEGIPEAKPDIKSILDEM
jgi:hypothetical protein